MLIKATNKLGNGYSKTAYECKDLPGKAVVCRSYAIDLLLKDYDDLEFLTKHGIRATPIYDIVDVQIGRDRPTLGLLMDKYDAHFKVYNGGGGGRQTFTRPVFEAAPYLNSFKELLTQVKDSGVGFEDMQFLFRASDHTAFISDPLYPRKQAHEQSIDDLTFLINAIESYNGHQAR